MVFFSALYFRLCRKLALTGAVLLAFIIASPSIALDCGSSFHQPSEIEKIILRSSAAQLLDPEHTGSGLTRRNWLTGKKVLPSVLEKIHFMGGMEWNLRIYSADSVEHALQRQREIHDQHRVVTSPKDAEVITYGTYILPYIDSLFVIDPDGSFKANNSEKINPDDVRKLVAEGRLVHFRHINSIQDPGKAARASKMAYTDSKMDKELEYDHSAGEMVPVTLEQLDQLFTPDQWDFDKNDGDSSLDFWVQGGLTLPQQKGIIRAQAFTGKKYKNYKVVMRDATQAGHWVSFSSDKSRPDHAERFREAIQRAAEQKRDSGVSSRYDSQEMINAAIKSFESGEAFSVEVRDKDGRIIGGTVNYLRKNQDGQYFIEGDTVFYQVKGDQKLAMAATIDRLQKAGIPFLDVAMVMGPTKFMAGETIFPSEFDDLVMSSPDLETADLDLVSDWIPEDNRNWE